MTRTQIKTVVKHCWYPGWKIRIDDEGDIEILAANVMDTDHPHRKPSDAPHAYVVQPWRFRKPGSLVAAIFDACARLAFHEVQESFRYRGRRPFDPHPGVRRR